MNHLPDPPFEAFFERGGLRAVFDHARNAVVATIIVAAGLETARRMDLTDLQGVFNPLLAGYLVAAVGCALIVLNFIDGLRRLARLRWHVGLQLALGVTYLLLSLRIVHLIIYIRTHTC
jgi:hypothetical protein